MLVTSAVSSGNKVSDTLNSLLSGAAAESQRKVVFETCIAALNTGLQTQVARDIEGTLLFQVCRRD